MPVGESEFDKQAKTILEETTKILFPTRVEASSLIKPHHWRDKKYLGEDKRSGKVVSWRGWSVNLVSVDFRYRAIFIDLVDNILSMDEQIRLFGAEFSQSVEKLSQFVVMFVLDFPANSLSTIIEQGYVPRRMSGGTKTLHACIVASLEEFRIFPALYWAAKLARLVILQRLVSIHRKPLDSLEVPLQNLLYGSGYLHAYLINNGLGLLSLSKPRKAGEFGHDFHAEVINPALPATIGMESRAFPLGIELYTGSLGYHSQTIPAYVNDFKLRGLIVIAKDDPGPSLHNLAANFYLPLQRINRLTEVGANPVVSIYHLPLQQVVADLNNLRDELETELPVVRIEKSQ
jgi:hypothetical protein